MRSQSLLVLAVLLALLSGQVFAAPQVKLNDQPLSFPVPPTLENNRVLVPMRAIFEALGAAVNWDGATQTVLATKGQITIKLQIGSPTAYKNDQAIELAVPAKVINSSTMVPLRFVSEALEADVNWIAESETVAIFHQPTPQEPTLMQIVVILDEQIPTSVVVRYEDGVGLFKDKANRTADEPEFFVVEDSDRFIILIRSHTATDYLEPVLKLFYPTEYEWIVDQAKKAYAPDVRDSRLPELASKTFDGRFLWFSGYELFDEGEMQQINIGKLGAKIPEFLLE